MNTLIRSLGHSLKISNMVVNNLTRNMSVSPISGPLLFTTRKINPIRLPNLRFSHSSGQFIPHSFNSCRRLEEFVFVKSHPTRIIYNIIIEE